MQASRLTVTREHPLKLPFLAITKLENPLSDSQQSSTSPNLQTPLKQSRRNKRTVPKPQFLNPTNGPPVVTPPTPPTEDEEEAEEVETSHIPISNSLSASVGLETDQGRYCNSHPDNLLSSVENYRRFSSRSRKKTRFFTVLCSDEQEVQTPPAKRKRSVGQPARRALKFDKLQELKQPTAAVQMALSEDVGVGVASADYKTQLTDNAVDLLGPPIPMETPQDSTAPDCNTETAPPTSPADSVMHETKATPVSLGDLQGRFPVGKMVWGKLPGYNWWPGTVISYDETMRGGASKEEGGGAVLGEAVEKGSGAEPQIWIKWFGENNLSQISMDRLAPFEQFSQYYQPMSMKGLYKKALMAVLKEAARRCKVEFASRPEDKKPRWTITDAAEGPKLIENSPPTANESEEGDSSTNNAGDEKQKELLTTPPISGGVTRKGRRGKGGRDRGAITLTALEQEMIDWALGGFQPSGPQGIQPTPEHNVMVRVVPMGGGPGESGERTSGQGDDDGPRKKAKVMLLQIRRKACFDSVLQGRMKITDLCISCGDMDVFTEHPLFEGGLCKSCKDNFMECAYLFDDDGTQMYCCICSGGEEVFMCDAENCAKVYCGPCIEKLCGSAEVEKVRAADKWLCYMCSEGGGAGLLTKREDWDRQLHELFMNDHEMEYDPPRSYPPVPPEERVPLRVLGLFDGIATGLLVLKELGIEVEKYISSEIDPDAVKISRVQHGDIIHVGNIAHITEKEVRAWGPFDLVMGGSPCNDLSIVNPARKGIYEGTGRLFFEFFRILSYATPLPNEERPFFWLYENVVSMRAEDKQIISRFLQCNPVVVDARDISPANRARYFWGNFPGMNRPTTPLPGDRLTLQECLEPNCFRRAQFTKLRTITTKMNSIKQTKKAIYPVRVEGMLGDGEVEGEEGDVLWCTEMERLFGFPDHYTDVGNLGRCGRQRLLGKAWSVPVIRHLLSPLKDYFRSSTVRETPSKTE